MERQGLEPRLTRRQRRFDQAKDEQEFDDQIGRLLMARGAARSERLAVERAHPRLGVTTAQLELTSR